MSTSPDLAPHRNRFAVLPPERAARWLETFPPLDPPTLGSVLGLRTEEVRLDYARLRLPYRPDLIQPAGVVHGGAIATLIDTVVVPALASPYESFPQLLTIDLQIQFMAALRGEDAIAEGWIVKRGRSIAFCRAEVLAASGELVATGTLTYRVRSRDAA